MTPRRVFSRMRLLTIAVLLAALAAVPASGTIADSPRSDEAKPTIVLVHGSWADAAGWSRVIRRLQGDGYKVAAVANPLRSLSADAEYVDAYLDTLTGPVVLVGHSYGGAVITNAATGNPQVEALVYVNAFAPDEGEDVTSLAGPDSALSVADPTTVFDFVPATLPPTPTTDVYLKTGTFLGPFAAGLPAKEAAVLAASQRSITLAALTEPAAIPAWRTIPSWSLIGTEDQIIPRSVQEAMADRAGSIIARYRAGHLGLISDPTAVTHVIERAAEASQ